MMIQAAVVEIDRADDGLAVVADENLRVDEARLVLIDLHAAVQKAAVIGVRQRKGDLLVRHVRQDELYLDAALRGVGQRRDHLIVDDEIRRHNVHIAVGAVDDVHIHHFADEIAVERTVAVGDDEAGRRARRLGHIEIARIGFGSKVHLVVIPHLEEHQRQIPHGTAAQGDGRVLPMAVALRAVDVFVGKVDAAGEADLTVNDKDLAVVAVIVMRGDEGTQRREHLAGDAELLQLLRIAVGQQRHSTGAVVHEADLHALLDLLSEDLEDAAPHVALAHDEVLKENKVLRALELFEHHGKSIVAERKIFRLRIPVAGKAAALQICRKTLRFLRQLAHGTGGGGGGERLCLRLNVVIAADHQPVAEVCADEKIQDQSKDRQHREDEEPCELDGRIIVAAEQRQHDHRREQRVAAPEVGHRSFEPVKSEEEEQDLHDERNNDDARAAEHDLKKPSLALFQKQDAVIVVFHRNPLS